MGLSRGPAVKTLHSPCKGPRFTPWGTRFCIPQLRPGETDRQIVNEWNEQYQTNPKSRGQTSILTNGKFIKYGHTLFFFPSHEHPGCGFTKYL